MCKQARRRRPRPSATRPQHQHDIRVRTGRSGPAGARYCVSSHPLQSTPVGAVPAWERAAAAPILCLLLRHGRWPLPSTLAAARVDTDATPGSVLTGVDWSGCDDTQYLAPAGPESARPYADVVLMLGVVSPKVVVVVVAPACTWLFTPSLAPPCRDGMCVPPDTLLERVRRAPGSGHAPCVQGGARDTADGRPEAWALPQGA